MSDMQRPAMIVPQNDPVNPTSTMQSSGTGLLRPWREVSSAPGFADLSYNSQLLLRDQWFQANAPQRSDWAEMSPTQKDHARNIFLSQPPVINPEGLTSTGQRF